MEKERNVKKKCHTRKTCGVSGELSSPGLPVLFSLLFKFSRLSTNINIKNKNENRNNWRRTLFMSVFRSLMSESVYLACGRNGKDSLLKTIWLARAHVFMDLRVCMFYWPARARVFLDLRVYGFWIARVHVLLACACAWFYGPARVYGFDLRVRTFYWPARAHVFMDLRVTYIIVGDFKFLELRTILLARKSGQTEIGEIQRGWWFPSRGQIYLSLLALVF